MVRFTPEQARAELARRARARDAAAELERRAKARADPAGWFEYGPPTEKGAPVLDAWQRDLLTRLHALAREWQALPEGPRPVWIINVDAPPQSGKSEVVKRFIAWSMAELGESWGYASYGASLAVAHSVVIRSLLRSQEARTLWRYLDGKAGRADESPKDTEDEWKIPAPSTERRGARLIARGRDGALTGRTMDKIAIDDLFKDSNDYGSGAARAEADGFLRSSVFARLQERGGWLLNVGTRWGMADTHAWLAERVAELRAAGLSPRVETWSYPLKGAPGDIMGRAVGEYLTHRWDAAKEAAARILYGRHASAILDGKPTPDGGTKFKREWYSRRYVGSPDAVARQCDYRVLAIDSASTQGEGDHSSVEHWGWAGVKMRLLHKHRGQWGSPELEQAIRDARALYRPNAIVIEDTSNGRAVRQRLQTVFPEIIPVTALGKSKAVKWDAQSPVFYAGNVEFPEPEYAPWMLDYIERMVVLTGEGEEIDDEADTWEIAARHRSTATATADPAAYLRVLRGMAR